MLKKKNIVLIFLAVFVIFTSNLWTANAHSPKFVDLKYYDDGVLSVYITHGVSDTDYHYVDAVIIEYYNLSESFINAYDGEHITEEYIFEEGSPTKSWEIVYNYTSQETHQIFHFNYTSLPLAVNWTIIKVTAICNKGGSFSHSLVVDHYPYYDEEHSMSEAIIPTLGCTIIVMTPLLVIGITRKDKSQKPKKRKKV
ncbi:MAG: hypothetical protein GY870_08905 [archaeon]|nr:hypothetical protein [archaeon]